MMDLSALIGKIDVFTTLDATQRDALAGLTSIQYYQGGSIIYHIEEPAQYVYALIYGRLSISNNTDFYSYINRFEIAGEIEILSGEARQTNLKVMRDSMLLCIERDAFLAFLNQHPTVLLALSQLIIRRTQVMLPVKQPMAKGRTLAIIPVSADIPALYLAEALSHQLHGWPSVRLVTAAHVDALFGEGVSQTALDYSAADIKLRHWLASLEEHHCYVLYAANNGHDGWTIRCLNQADRTLILAEANRPPLELPLSQILHAHPRVSPIELVLLRSAGDPSPYTLDWKKALHARAHYFVHPWAKSDISALARQITSKGLGLVLGGGGARGFAHIGLIRALEQLNIPVDIVGGTSMGAFVAALVACGFDSVEMTHIAHETFVARNYLNDYTMPRVSLIRGQRFHARLHAIFGKRRIEELRHTFYCISTNLTTGQPVVHDQGELATWVGSSMSVPGVAPPVAWHENLLCDGGVINNLPTDVMQNLERGTIIASNVSLHGDIRAPGIGLEEPDQSALLNWHKIIKDKLIHAPRLAEILMRTATLASDTMIQNASIEKANLHIKMPIDGIGMFEWHRLDDLIELGYQHALEVLLPIRDTLPE
jgi:NTE family protein